MADAVATTVMGLIVFASILLNGSALYIFLHMKQKMELVQILLTSIAICDLVQAILGFIPDSISGMFPATIDENNHVCVVSGYIVFSCAITVIMHIASLSIIRSLAVRNPIKYRLIVNNRFYMKIIMAFCYFWGFIWPAFPFMKWSYYAVDLDHRRCSLDWNLKNSYSFSYILSVIFFTFIVPISALITSTVLAVLKVRRNKHSEVRRNSSLAANSKIDQMEKSYIRLVVTMAILFVIAWTPYTITGLFAVFHMPPNKNLVTASAMFAKLSAVFNPVANGFINKPFRKRLHRIVFVQGLRGLIQSDPKSTYETTQAGTDVPSATSKV